MTLNELYEIDPYSLNPVSYTHLFVFMVEKTSFMFITGPQVVKTVTSEEIDAEALGGSKVHGSQSGVAHFTYRDEETCLEGVKTLLSYLPQNNRCV